MSKLYLGQWETLTAQPVNTLDSADSKTDFSTIYRPWNIIIFLAVLLTCPCTLRVKMESENLMYITKMFKISLFILVLLIVTID